MYSGLRYRFCLLETHAKCYSRNKQCPTSGIHWLLDLCGSCRKGELDVDRGLLRSGYVLIAFIFLITNRAYKKRNHQGGTSAVLVIVIIIGCMKRKKKTVKSNDTEMDWTDLADRDEDKL